MQKTNDKTKEHLGNFYQSGNRLIRLKDAPQYLGMKRHSFNLTVRRFVTELPIGKTGIAFDKLELDAWLEHYKQSCGRPPTKRLELWDARKTQVSTNVERSGTLINTSSEEDFVKVLAQVYSVKRKST